MKNHPSWVRGIQMDTQYTHFYAGKSTYCYDSSSLIYKRLHALFSFLPSVFLEITSLCFFLLYSSAEKRCPEKRSIQRKYTEKRDRMSIPLHSHPISRDPWSCLFMNLCVFLCFSLLSSLLRGLKKETSLREKEETFVCLHLLPFSSFSFLPFPFLWQPFCLEGHHQYFPLLLHLLFWIIISRWNTRVKITVIRAV